MSWYLYAELLYTLIAAEATAEVAAVVEIIKAVALVEN